MSVSTFLRILFGWLLCLIASFTPSGVVVLSICFPVLMEQAMVPGIALSAIALFLLLVFTGLTTILGEWPDD